MLTDEQMLEKYQPLAEAAFPKPGHTRRVLLRMDEKFDEAEQSIFPLGMFLLGVPDGRVWGQTSALNDDPDDPVFGDEVTLRSHDVTRHELAERKFVDTLFHEYAHTVGYMHGPEMDEVVNAAMRRVGVKPLGDDEFATVTDASMQLTYPSARGLVESVW
jgi:hypothetical protein